MEKVVPLVSKSTHVLHDCVEFLYSRLVACSTMSCKVPQVGVGDNPVNPVHNEELVRIVLKKFLAPMLQNYAGSCTDNEQPFIVFNNKPLNRKYQAFS